MQAADEADLEEKIETQNVEDGFCEIFVKEPKADNVIEELKGEEGASEIARDAERNIIAWTMSDEYQQDVLFLENNDADGDAEGFEPLSIYLS